MTNPFNKDSPKIANKGGFLFPMMVVFHVIIMQKSKNVAKKEYAHALPLSKITFFAKNRVQIPINIINHSVISHQGEDFSGTIVPFRK